MPLFELLVALLIAAAVLTTLARRLGVAYPVMLALAGALLALVPAQIPVRLDPELVLALFVAPLLLNAAFDTSLRDLRANWLPVTSLVLFCVIATVAAVAMVARWLVPDMPWAVAIALGAIVAPPDATAAIAVLRLVAPPHRVLVILEGESLLNDASALLIYRLAVGVAMGESATAAHIVPTLLVSAGGGCLLGFALGWVSPLLLRRVEDIPAHVVMQFAATFAAWVLADVIGASPVLTVVVYAMTLARTTALDQDAENRRMSFAVWDVAAYALTALAYILIGLELKEVIAHSTGRWAGVAMFSLSVLAAVILARMAWVLLYNRGWAAHRRFMARRGTELGGIPTWGSGLVVAWSGMRGVITLATALALPMGENGGPAFPHRDLLIAAAFTVVLGTLLLQGLTLKPLLRWVDLPDDDVVGREERLARHEGAQAAIAMLGRRPESEASLLRREYKVRLREQSAGADVSGDAINRLRLDAIHTERRILDRLRRSHRIGDDAYHTVEEELDWAESHAIGRQRAGVDEPPPEDETNKGPPA